MAKTGRKSKKELAHHKFAVREPKLTVLTDHALESEEAHLDSFNLRNRVGPVYDIIRHPDIKTPMAVAVYGDWGAGKTTAMRWLNELIDEWNENGKAERKIKVRPVWFYPWKYDTKEDVWRGLISEVIIKSINVEGATLQTVKKAAKRFGVFLGRSFLHVLEGIKPKAKIPGDIAEAEVDLAEIIKGISAEYKEAAHPEKAYLNEFESTLKEWIKDTLGEDERMVIFIDDLDRCMPEIALQVLEALKLYLNIEKLIFVVGVDRKVVDKLVKKHYTDLGLDEKKGKNYLSKMFQIEVEVEPSERQISDFLDESLKDIGGYWETDLEDEEREIFRGLIFKLAGRIPREVKRLINSSMMMGAGVMMAEGAIGFDQGLQLFFVRKILDEEYTMGTETGSRRGIDFFGQWSKIVVKGRKKDSDFPCTVKVPEDYTKQLEEDREEVIKGSLDEVSEKMKKRDALEKPPFAPEAYYNLLKEPRFSGLLHLLGDEDLGELMRIEYPAEVVEIAAVVGTSKDAEIIREAIAAELGKKPDELTGDDYKKVTKLDLGGREISNLEPLKGLSGLQKLNLSGTQVSSVEPLKGLGSLERLDLSGTQVSSVEPLKGLGSLQMLWLSDTQVSSVEPLEGLGSLQVLYLSGTQVSSVEPLKGLGSLQWLSLSDTQVSSVEPLKGLGNLKTIGLSGTQVSDEDVARLKEALPKVEIFR